MELYAYSSGWQCTGGMKCAQVWSLGVLVAVGCIHSWIMLMVGWRVGWQGSWRSEALQVYFLWWTCMGWVSVRLMQDASQVFSMLRVLSLSRLCWPIARQ